MTHPNKGDRWASTCIVTPQKAEDTRSWWADPGLTREEFDAKAREEEPRMQQQKFGQAGNSKPHEA